MNSLHKAKQLFKDMMLDGIKEIETLTQFEIECLIESAVIHGKDVVLEVGRIIKNPKLIEGIDYVNKLEDKKNDIYELRKAGLTYKEIAKEVCVEPSSVKNFIHDNRIKKGDLYTENVLQLRKEGLTSKEIANMLGIKVRAVTEVVSKNSVTSKIKRVTKNEIIETLKLIKNGYSYPKIEKKLNLSKNRVASNLQRLRRKHNLENNIGLFEIYL